MIRPTLTSPRSVAAVHPAWLATAALVSVCALVAVEVVIGSPMHPNYVEMLSAARTVQSSHRVLEDEKRRRGLLTDPQFDPNQTGMIGYEYTSMTTTLGDLHSKRSTTNPDFAAAVVGIISSLNLPAGTQVPTVLSGSFVGANTAVIAALESLDLIPVVVVSLSASMWGANQPGFNWLDMMNSLREAGLIRTVPVAAVFGGQGAIGGNIDQETLDLLRSSAERGGVPVVEAKPVSALMDRLVSLILAKSGGQPAPLVINVGGSLVGLGSCRESYEFVPGLSVGPIKCSGGTPGLLMRLVNAESHALHVLNIRRLSLEWGLPFDPTPLPSPGENTRVYGRPNSEAVSGVRD